MSKRKRRAIPVSTRFEVFKRDSFTCQYCGRAAPAVVLELEHIHPHSKGGADEVLNLITSCWECNRGKGDRVLSDDAVIRRQHDQLAEFQERREQIEMLLRWRESNAKLDDVEVDAICNEYSRKTGWYLNEKGRASMNKLIRKHGLARCLDALDRAVDHVAVYENGKLTQDSADSALRMLHVMAEPDDVQAMYRLRARIRNRWNYVHDGRTIGILRNLLRLGASASEIEARCNECMRERNTSFRWWCGEMEEWSASLSEATEGQT